jgi:hypothetical protein
VLDNTISGTLALLAFKTSYKQGGTEMAKQLLLISQYQALVSRIINTSLLKYICLILIYAFATQVKFAQALSKSECIGYGGPYLCTKPLISQWKYSPSDNMSDLPNVRVARCTAQGGVWQGTFSSPPCLGG